MNPEIWTLVQSREVGELVEYLAASENAVLRSFQDVSEMLSTQEPAGGMVLVIDSMQKYANYLTIIKRFQKNFFAYDVVVFGPAKSREAIEAEREAGVDLYVEMPVDRDDYLVRASHVMALRRLKVTTKIIGRSRTLDEMLERALQVAPTEVSVLIEGESGSGKELTAKAIHLMSRRRDKSFEAVNCGALAEGVLESELFGHEKGSFTGAITRRIGLFERADGGTLFLDEVGEMPLNMQVRLLRVIETGEFLRVGGTEKVKSDVRIIAATNRELDTAVERGDFRKDLYYRLKVVQIRIPPLRARSADIPFLVRYFKQRSAQKHRKTVRGIEKEGMKLLLEYPWPGNVRELSNVIDHLTVLSTGSVIRAEDIKKRLNERMTDHDFMDLPVHVRRNREEVERELILSSLLSLNNDVREILKILKGETFPGGFKRGGWVEVKEPVHREPRSMESVKREAIMEALSASGGNRRKAAKRLGISERTLYRRIKEYDIS